MTKHPKETERLKKIVESFPKMTVTVVGDLVADEFVFGEISRVSREAPVLILKHRDRSVMPGGGADAYGGAASGPRRPRARSGAQPSLETRTGAGGARICARIRCSAHL